MRVFENRVNLYFSVCLFKANECNFKMLSNIFTKGCVLKYQWDQ